ncbi:Fur family transcriptional regulator [Anaerosoma tenue]|uniref:Fur family transcriptional regulator n=1 Tax=Anaerosoma tenue TaxID=2933588 RepID=UPI002260F4B6|nr:transcriptional repressor [Anaerosoma tenue]MCK8115721.1 transcriptional repressor [Anaerosoma tenue]
MDADHQRDPNRCTPTTLYGTARVSAQRAVIARVVREMRTAFTAEELHLAVADASPGIGLATVYRAISAMQEAGAVVTVGDRDGSALLALCVRNDHHHHLVCTRCGRVLGVECPLGDAVSSAATREGHLVTSHEVVLYGLCVDCREGTRGA